MRVSGLWGVKDTHLPVQISPPSIGLFIDLFPEGLGRSGVPPQPREFQDQFPCRSYMGSLWSPRRLTARPPLLKGAFQAAGKVWDAGFTLRVDVPECTVWPRWSQPPWISCLSRCLIDGVCRVSRHGWFLVPGGLQGVNPAPLGAFYSC